MCSGDPYEPGCENLVVSPVNARRLLSDYLKDAKKSLTIYDPKISDSAMIGLLAERARAGVDIKVIGRMTRGIPGVEVRKSAIRADARTMVRDGNLVFVGSQSLRALELDARREVGIIVRHPKIGPDCRKYSRTTGRWRSKPRCRARMKRRRPKWPSASRKS